MELKNLLDERADGNVPVVLGHLPGLADEGDVFSGKFLAAGIHRVNGGRSGRGWTAAAAGTGRDGQLSGGRNFHHRSV